MNEDIPFISNNFPEAVDHAIVTILAHAFACLNLSLRLSTGVVKSDIHCKLTLGF
jgi:hypothetical protein